MKPSLRHLFALPLAIAIMGGLGCDSGSSSYGDRDANAPQPEEEAQAQTPGWVTNVAVAKADITVTGMT